MQRLELAGDVEILRKRLCPECQLHDRQTIDIDSYIENAVGSMVLEGRVVAWNLANIVSSRPWVRPGIIAVERTSLDMAQSRHTIQS
jgi:hypothetical protein